MFTLKIHTVDFPQTIHTAVNSTAASGGATANNDLRPSQLMGVAHLFRQLLSPSAPPVTIANITARTTLVFVVAVPSYMSSDDFLRFCGNHVPHFVEVLFLRNDGMEDRYSVLIKLESQFAADGFYCSYNGKRFKPSEVERLDPDTSGIQSTSCDHSFRCSCVSKWTYLSCPVCQLCQQQDEKPSCVICGSLKNLWICLICGFVGCGRYEKGHASGHSSDKHHRFSLEIEKQQIWDYVGDRYVHRLNQSKVDRKSVIPNSRCNAAEECETCRYEEEEGLDGALFSSKIEGILDEYNRLLASQLDAQRQHFESLLAEVKSRKDSSTAKAVEKAIFSRTHDLEDKLGKYAEEKKAVADKNQELMKKQELLQNKFKEIEERERTLVQLKNEQILDLQEQVRDLKVYVEAQRMVTGMADSDGIRGGTVLSVESKQSSSASGNPKRRAKLGRRRN